MINIKQLKYRFSIKHLDENIIDIFNVMGNILTESNYKLSYANVEKITEKFELPSEYSKEFIEILKNNNLISYNENASGGIFNIKLTYIGVIAYCANFRDDFETIISNIYSEISNNRTCTTEMLTEKYELTFTIVNGILEYFENNGTIRLIKHSSGSYTTYH